jgi:hypothetical protein
MFNLFRLTLRLEWPALIRFIDTKARRFIFISLNHGDEPLLGSFWCFDRNYEAITVMLLMPSIGDEGG